MSREKWVLDMTATPVVEPWHNTNDASTNGSELQRAIIHGFSQHSLYRSETDFRFEKTFTFKEHGEFFRGAPTMAGIRYANDFYELLQRYGTLKVVIVREKRIDE